MRIWDEYGISGLGFKGFRVFNLYGAIGFGIGIVYRYSICLSLGSGLVLLRGVWFCFSLTLHEQKPASPQNESTTTIPWFGP